MIDALLSVVDFLVSILQFFINTLMSIFWIIGSIPNFVSSITAIFAYCPTGLLVYLEICIALTILFAVIKLMK